MPSSININGTTTRRPGVFSTVNVNALSGLTLDINRVAIVGSFPSLQQATPKEVSNATDLAAIDPSDVNLARIAKLLYRPSNDDRVAGGPSATILVSCNESSQAAFSLLDADNEVAQVALKSKIWGATGNRVTGSYNRVTNALTLKRDGLTESFTDLSDEGYISIYYAGSAANKANVTIGPETGIKVEQGFQIDSSEKKDGPGDQTITLTGSELDGLAFDGTIKFTIVGAGAANASAPQTIAPDAKISITGTRKSDGATATVAYTIAAGQSSATSDAFSAVTKIFIQYFSAGTTNATSVDETKDWYVENDAFNLTAASYPKLQGVFDAINNNTSSHNYTVSSTNPRLSTVATNTIDYNGDAATIVGAGAAKQVTRNLQKIIDTVNLSSTICTATRSTISESGNVGVYEPNTQTFQLAGGAADGSESQSDWDAAIDALQNENVQIIVPITDAVNNSAVAAKLVAHCKYMGGVGQSERNFWYGAPAASMGTVDLVVAAAQAINSRHGAMVAQQVKVFDHLSQSVTLDAPYAAVMLAGIQAGTGIAEPMTHKRVDVIDTITSWDANSSSEKLIRNGVSVITKDRLGFRVERSVTTYLINDNPVFCEVSANESLNTCIRDLRNFVVSRIGTQNVNGTKHLVRTIALTRLRQQVLDGIIKSFDADALQVTDLGDRLRIDARIAVVEPLNFIVINAEVVRTPTA